MLQSSIVAVVQRGYIATVLKTSVVISVSKASVVETPPNQNPYSDESDSCNESDSCKVSIIKVQDEPREFEDEAKSITVAFQPSAAATTAE